MAGLSGRDVWFQLRHLEHVAPVMFVTGDPHGAAGLEEETAVLEKPFTIAQLRSFVDHALSTP